MAEIITTVDSVEKMTGVDKHYEIRKPDDHPLKEVDQSKIISTHNMVPNKRKIEKKDVNKIVSKLKNEQKEKSKKTRKDKAEKKTTRNKEVTDEK